MKIRKPSPDAARLIDQFIEAGVKPDEVTFHDDGRITITISAMKKLAALAVDPAEANRQVAEMEALSDDLRKMDERSNARASGQIH